MEEIMKKVIFFILSILLPISLVSSQELIDVYKTGKLFIQSDSDFETNSSLIELLNRNENSLQSYSNLVISADEDIYILDRNEHQILKLDRSGNLLKTINLENKKSKSVYHRKRKIEILDNKHLLVLGYSTITIYDLKGTFIKKIEIDYPLYSLVALKNSKVCIKGFVSLKNGRTKIHIAIIDIETEKETFITKYIMDRGKEFIVIKTKDRGWLSGGSGQRAPKVYINRTLDGNLIVGNSKNPEISIYDNNGKSINKINLNISALKVEQKVKDDIYKSIKELILKYNAPDSLLKVIESPDFYYENMPYFYDIKVDSDNNVLIFINTKEKNHLFRVYQVYSKDGKFICETTLEPGNFEVPNLRLLNFSKGKLYALLQLKDEDKNGIRLIKMNVK